MKDCANVVVTTTYYVFGCFLSCLILNNFIPRLVLTERAAQQFWPVGAAAIIICSAGFALLNTAWGQPSSLMVFRVFKAIGTICEVFIFISAIVILIEGFQYVARVEQLEVITAHSGADIRYWVAAILLMDGILGNLLAALLMF